MNGSSIEDSTAATNRIAWIWIISVCVVAALIYLRLLHAPFLPWDDDVNISANPYYSQLSWLTLWRQPYFGLYVPVTGTMWAALFAIGSGAAWPFRAANILLHLANIILVWRLAMAATDRLAPGRQTRLVAAVAAGLFALHPLQVGAVAWISGGRDLLATCFGLLATLFYFRRRRLDYALATVLFAAALLSKPSVAGMPLAIVAFALLFERDRLAVTLTEMLPWVAMVLAVAIATSAVQSDMVAVSVPLLRRPFVVLDALGFYLLKLAWPVGLSVDYGRTPGWLASHPAIAAPTLLAVSVVAVALVIAARRRRVFALTATWLLLLLPVLGVAPFAFQRISTVADHYAYFPMAALVVCLSVALAQARARVWPVAAVLGVMSVVWAGASAGRTDVWRSGDDLFTDALARNPRSWSALTNLGRSSCYRGELDAGILLLDSALSIKPAEATGLANRAFCLYRAHRYIEVVDMGRRILDPAVQSSLERNDRAAASLSNIIAAAYFTGGDLGSGWPFLCQALSITPYDDDLKANAAQVEHDFAAKGITPRCPGRLSWKVFSSLVGRLGPG